MERLRTIITKINLNIIRKVKKLMLPNFKTYFNATVIKIMWHWQKDRELTENRETIDSSKIDLPVLKQLICNEGTRAVQWGKDIFQQMVLKQLDDTCPQKRTLTNTHTLYKN